MCNFALLHKIPKFVQNLRKNEKSTIITTQASWAATQGIEDAASMVSARGQRDDRYTTHSSQQSGTRDRCHAPQHHPTGRGIRLRHNHPTTPRGGDTIVIGGISPRGATASTCCRQSLLSCRQGCLAVGWVVVAHRQRSPTRSNLQHQRCGADKPLRGCH